MGQRYESDAVVGDGTPFPPYRQDQELHYEPTSHPGAYLPHAWLERGGKRVSTLDLVPSDTWTVITGIEGQYWIDAAKHLSAEFGLGIASAMVGPGQEIADVYGTWARACEISDGGVLLVRPDKYVAWRADDVIEDPVGGLRDALTRILRPER